MDIDKIENIEQKQKLANKIASIATCAKICP